MIGLTDPERSFTFNDLSGISRSRYMYPKAERQGVIRILFELDGNIPPLTPDQFTDHAWDFDLNSLEMNRTHWAVKDVAIHFSEW